MVVKQDILQGWSEIAVYLSRDVRTVKRWEKQRGLPVRRMQGAGRANVYAFQTEVDLWLVSRSGSEAESSLEAGPVELEPGETEELFATPTLEADSSREEPASVPAIAVGSGRERRPAPYWLWVASFVAIGLLATGLVALRREPSRADLHGHVDGAAGRGVLLSQPNSSRAGELARQGSYLFEQRTPETLEEAKRDFEQAIAEDAKYAPAYAGLAKVYDLLREYSTMPSTEAFPRAREAAEHAIALDPRLADAHTALGFEEFFWGWDRVSAEREFKLAIALDPNSAIAHQWYGSMLTHLARFPEALVELDRAQELQPASPGVLRTRAYAIGLSGRRNEASDQLQEILTKVPDSASLHFVLAQLSLLEPRDISRYLSEMRRFAALRHDAETEAMLAPLEPIYRKAGEEAMWRAMLAREERMHPAPAHRTYQMAQAEAALGQSDAVLRDLQQLEADHDPALIGIKIEPLLSSLRADPRFAVILDQMRLPH